MTSTSGRSTETIATRDDWVRSYGTRLFQAPLEFESPADERAHWILFLNAAIDAIALVRAGAIEQDAAFRRLHDWAERYFDTEDDESRLRIQWVLKSFKMACLRGKHDGRSRAPKC